MPRLTYDAVIATRNRAEALTLTLPILLSQSIPPSRLIVIDSSENHASAAQAVEHSVRKAGYEGEVLVEDVRPGLPYQRNRGLAHVQAPIVMFLDDDSVMYPGAAEEILKVYARDRDGCIAGVCAAEAIEPPVGLDVSYDMSSGHRREARFRGIRNWLERQITALKPALSLGRALNARHGQPEWLESMDVVPVEYMTGFRMTFRTDAIRREGFDEALGGYAVDEDIDASFSAMRSGLVVGARRAKIYHHRYPSGRSDAYNMGRMTVFNRAHVLLKHASGPAGSAALTNAIWRRHLMFAMLKIAVCLPGARRSDARARLAGVWAGHLAALQLWHTSPSDWMRGSVSVEAPHVSGA